MEPDFFLSKKKIKKQVFPMIFKCKIMKNLNSMSNFDFQAKTHTHNTLLYHPLTQISTGASQYEEHFDCIQHFSASFVFFSHFSRPVYICCWCWTGQNRIFFFDFLIGKNFFFRWLRWQRWQNIHWIFIT